MRISLSADAEDRMLEALAARLKGGELCFYDLTPPSHADAKVSLQRHLASLAVEDAAMVDGQLRVVTQRDALAHDSGNTTWARAFDSDGLVIFDLDVGRDGEGCAITFNATDLRKGGPVVVREFAIGIRRR